MSDQMVSGPVRGLYRYPVKGLTADPMETVDLAIGETFPFDRAWAIEHGQGRFDPDQPQYLPKVAFLMVMRQPELTSLQTTFDAATCDLTIRRQGNTLAQGRLTSEEGCRAIEAFFAEFLGDALHGPLRVVHAKDHSFSDVPIKCVHILNLASVRALEREMGRTVDPARFRANIVVDLPLPWMEFSWVGKQVSLGGVTLDVLDRTERCAATNAAPGAGKRDMEIPATLERAYGHMDMGIYATVAEAGQVGIGDSITGPPP